MNILIVDDNPDTLKLLHVTLDPDGYKVIEAVTDAREIEKFKMGKIDAIISDIALPPLEGYHIPTVAREKPGFKTLPFNIYTSKNLSPGAEKVVNAMGDDAGGSPMSTVNLQGVLLDLFHARGRGKNAKTGLSETQDLRESNDLLVKKLEDSNRELEQANRSLVDTQQKMSELVENITEVLFVSSADHKSILYVSPGYEGVWGKSCESLYEDAGSWIESIHPHDRLRIKKIVEANEGDGQKLEYRIVRPDASVRWIQARTIAVRKFGDILRYVGVAADVTERMKMEIALRDRDAQLTGFFEASTAGMAIIDKNLCYRRVNEPLAQMNGSSVAEHDGQRIRDMLPEIGQAAEVLVQKVFDTGKPLLGVPRRGETPGQPGVPRDWTVSYFPILGLDSQVSSIGAVVVEITEQFRLQECLRQAQKMEAVGQLAGGVAHDFNNLLSVILGYSDMILKSLADGVPLESLTADVEEVKDAATRAATLTRQLLAFSRRQILQTTVLCLNDSVLAMEKMLRRLIGVNFDLRSDLDPRLGSVRADAAQIEQLIMNTVLNARDAMSTGGKISIKTENVSLTRNAFGVQRFTVEPGDYVLLSVSDTGHGMDAATKLKVFEPFFTTKDKDKGTGLGLSTVYGIVKQSQGYVMIESEVGRGTTIRNYFPRTTEMVCGSEPIGVESVDDGVKTILLVDHDACNRNMVERFLSSKRYNVISAANGEEALTLSRQRSDVIDLLLTDHQMPGLSANDLAAQIGVSHPETRSLFISGYSIQPVFRNDISRSGPNFLAKPFTWDVLKARIERILLPDPVVP